MNAVQAPVCLVTGGAGFLGINLIRRLLALGYPVRSLDIAAFDYPEQAQVDAILGDIRSEETVAAAMAGVGMVIHCAAALPMASEADIRSTTVDGTRLLLQAAQQQGVQRFIFISTTAVYGVPDQLPIRETHALHGVGPYGEAKIEAERLCERQRSPSLCVTILRPKSFVGPERLGVFELLYDWAYEGRNFPVLGSGDKPYQLLDVEDLCEAIVLCLRLEPKLVSDTFNVGALRYDSLRQSFQAVLDRAGHGRRVVSIPSLPARWLLGLFASLGLSPLYRWVYESACHSSVVSTQRLQSRTGFRPRRSNREALLRNYDWYVKHRAAIGQACGVTHRKPLKRGFLRFAKWVF